MSHSASRVAYSALVFTLASHAAFAIATPPGTEAPWRVIRYADLNIEHPAGAAALYQRIRIAARVVCQPDFSAWQLTFIRDTSHCREDAIDRAVNEVNAAALTSYHRAHNRPAADRR